MKISHTDDVGAPRGVARYYKGTAAFIMAALAKARKIEAQQVVAQVPKRISECACGTELRAIVAFFPRWHSFAVECRWCGARGQAESSELQAIANWNAGLLSGLSTQQKVSERFPSGRWTSKSLAGRGPVEVVQPLRPRPALSAPGRSIKEGAC